MSRRKLTVLIANGALLLLLADAWMADLWAQWRGLALAIAVLLAIADVVVLWQLVQRGRRHD